MKKSLLALAVSALAAASIASTASATTVYDKDGTSMGIYGRVQSVFYSENHGTDKTEGSIDTSARMGFDLRTPLTSGIDVFALAEWEAANGNGKNDEADGFDARYLWVGFDFGQFGQVKIGKFEEAIKYAIGPTDHWEDAGCTGLAGNDDRSESVIMYQWSGYGVDAYISYAMARDNEHLDGAYFWNENVNRDWSVSAALGYTSPDVLFGPIGVRVGYLAGELNNGDVSFNNTGMVGLSPNVDVDGPYNLSNGVTATYYTELDSYDQWAVSAFWGSLAQGPYVAAAYQCRSFDYNGYDLVGGVLETYTGDYDVRGMEFTVAYTFQNGLRLATGYEMQTIAFDDEDGDVDAATVPVLALWKINPNFDVWAEARFDAGTDDDENGGKNFDDVAGTTYSENVFSLGARYNF